VSNGWLNFLEWALGFDRSRLPPGADVHLTWSHKHESWGALLVVGFLLAVAWAVFALYRRELDVCPRPVKYVLAALRVAVLLALAGIYFEPALTYSEVRTELPSIVVLRDASQSMATADPYLDTTAARSVAEATGRSIDDVRAARPARAALVNDLLARDEAAFLRRLQARGMVRVLDFSSHVEQAASLPAAERTAEDETAEGAAAPLASGDPVVSRLPPLQPAGSATDLHRAIHAALAQPLVAAAVVFTDGQHTTKDDPVAAADEARHGGAQGRGVPLFIVGVGDPSLPRNLRVAEVYANRQVWEGEPFEIKASLYADGIEQQPVLVELIEQPVAESGTPQGSPRSLQSLRVELPKGGGLVPVVFTHTPRVPGHFAYTVRTPALPNELSAADNEFSPAFRVRVHSEQAKVLLIAGSPTWEYRALQRLLTRDRTVHLSCWLQTLDPDLPQEGNDPPLEEFPSAFEDLLAYNVIILIDPDPREFVLTSSSSGGTGQGETWVDHLKRVVSDHGRGVLYMAGPKFAGRFLSSEGTREMRDLLPVRMGDVDAMEVASLMSANTRQWPLLPVTASLDQPIMRFVPESSQNIEVWKKLPGMYWSFPAQEAKPGARVLLEHADSTLRRAAGSRPLLVTGRYGAGRSVYVGFNGTWRWRRVGHQAEYFDRFWMQTTWHLVGDRSPEARRRGEVRAEREWFDLGDAVAVTAELKDSADKPLAVPSVRADLSAGEGPPSTVVLKQVADQSGTYEATITATRTGNYVLTVRLDDAAPEDWPKLAFDVRTPAVEANQVWLNVPLLRELAERSGGDYFSVNQLDELASRIPDSRQSVVMPGKPAPLWDNNRVLILLVVLLGIEWVLRKRNRLL
jgi:uncharacterized membrane protein